MSKDKDLLQTLQTQFSAYSVKDIAETLFISSLWLPNISSWYKHQFMVTAFISANPQIFSVSNKITTYEKFSTLLEEIYPLLPSMPSMEDYVPEMDWGDVKYFFEDTSYKIFYGCNIETIYDFLYVFDLMYVSHDEVIQSIVKRSPKTEMMACLELQDTIISCIETDLDEIDFEKIGAGYIEIPSEKFWSDARAYYNAFDSIEFVPKVILDNYSVTLGSDEFTARLEDNSLINLASMSELIDIFFVEYQDRHYPILPRMFSEVLIQQWTKIFDEYKEELSSKIDYQKKLTLDILVYMMQRHNEKELLALPSPVSSEGIPEDPIFSCGFISRNRLFLVYVAHPIIDSDTTQSELNKLSTELNKALELLSKEPTTLALHMEQGNVVFSSKHKLKLKPEIIVVLPSVSIDGIYLAIPDELMGHVIAIHDFLGLFDELNNLKELNDFFDFLEENEPNITIKFYSYVDKFGVFHDTQGVIVHGAREYDGIFLDPHWGSNKRFETLKNFWNIFPSSVGKSLGHPRSWSIKMINEKAPSLESRQNMGVIILCNVGSVLILLQSPFHLVTFEVARIIGLLMEAIHDSLTLNGNVLVEHSFFQSAFTLKITFYSTELVFENEVFQYLHHLKPSEKGWNLDSGYLEPRIRGIRIVIDEAVITDTMFNSTDRTLEAEILSDILVELNNFIPSSNIKDILKDIKLFGDNEPRYKMHQLRKMASFPDYISPSKPEEYHRKVAGKLVAQIALREELSSGKYEADNAKRYLDKIKTALIATINKLVREYSYYDAIPFLIGKIDALTDEHFRSSKSIEASLIHEVDYDRAERSASDEIEFVLIHQAYRYLIEKFVQLRPTGSMVIQEPDFQSLIALIQRLIQVYQASDSLHYGAYPVTISIDEDFIIDVIYNADIEDMQQIYHQEMAEIAFGLRGDRSDQVHIEISMSDFLDQMDYAFDSCLGFRLSTMLAVLQVLSLWADLGFSPHEEAKFYSATLDELKKVFDNEIRDTSQIELNKVIDFLVLSPDQILTIKDDSSQADDLPIWEHYKRPYRYNTRPLIRIEDKYYWGSHSTNRTMGVWMSSMESGKLPFNTGQREIDKIIKDKNSEIQKAIVIKTSSILSDFTNHIEIEVELHKKDRAGKHPQKLGDYDVLAYFQDHNILLNIECKDILPAFCLKDDSRIRRKYFGQENSSDRGFLGKVENREDYLKNNIQPVFKALGWETKEETPKVISMFVTKRSYWWTRFPPVETNVKFTILSTLRDFVANL